MQAVDNTRGIVNDILYNDTVPIIAGWDSTTIPDINNYDFLVITCLTSDQGSYSSIVSVSDFKSMNAQYAYIVYGTSNADRIMVCYSSDTALGLYNTHGSCTIHLRGIK